MKYCICLLLIFSSLTAFSQQKEFEGKNWEAPYHLATPKNWGVERFLLPAPFASSIPYNGMEDIRFTPGWGKQESNDYWSYAFVWYLDSTINPDVPAVEKNLSAYYTGLMKVNIDTTRIKAPEIPIANVKMKEIQSAKGSVRSFEGTVNTLDFLTWKPISFNLRIHVRWCPEDNKTLIFHEISPRPYSDMVWKSLDELWEGLRCRK